MAINQALLAELKQESTGTRKTLQRVPTAHLTWKPHEKSFTLGHLASHVSQLLTWFDLIINRDGLNFATDNIKTVVSETNEDLVKRFDEYLAHATAVLESASDEVLNSPWTMQNGDHIYFTLPKKVVIRSWYYNHMIHHRGQLTVYLRLLDIPVPGLYGPSADER